MGVTLNKLSLDSVTKAIAGLLAAKGSCGLSSDDYETIEAMLPNYYEVEAWMKSKSSLSLDDWRAHKTEEGIADLISENVRLRNHFRRLALMAKTAPHSGWCPSILQKKGEDGEWVPCGSCNCWKSEIAGAVNSAGEEESNA